MSRPGQYNELREKMAVVKNLYCSKHYTQCAKLGELLLSEAHDETHPLHLAHINFYTALSHDTLGREAKLKARRKEFSQAEKYYLAAIDVLSPQPQVQASPQESQQDSPDSAFSDLVFPWHRRGSNDSLGSRLSGASSATSLFYDELNSFYETGPNEQQHPPSPRTSPYGPSASNPYKRHDSATALYHPSTPSQYRFSANVASFVRMLQRHLAEVRDLRDKSSVPTVHFTAPSPQNSPKSEEFRPCSRNASLCTETADAARRRRRTVVFRPRFDPASVRQLCNEAIAELAE